MWYKKIYLVIFISMVFFTIVKGSCLEYGHSCWGAHGKRSGGGGKILAAANSNLRNDLTQENVNGILAGKPFFDNFDELVASVENSPHTSSAEAVAVAVADANNNIDAGKLRNALRIHNTKFRNRNNNIDDGASAAVIQQQAERWRTLPLFQLKASLRKPALPAAENDLLQQLERETASKAAAEADESVYYDFK